MNDNLLPDWFGKLRCHIDRIIHGPDWIAMESHGVWMGWRTPGRPLSVDDVQPNLIGMVEVIQATAEHFTPIMGRRPVGDDLARLVVKLLERNLSKNKFNGYHDVVPTANNDGDTLYEVVREDDMVVSVGRPPDILIKEASRKASPGGP